MSTFPSLRHRGPRRAKYGNKKTVVDGITFDSKAEAKRYVELRTLALAHQITRLECQAKFPIFVDGPFGRVKVCDYVADFFYITRAGASVVEDVKGFKTPVYNLKKKLLKAATGIEIQEIGGRKPKRMIRATRKGAK